MPKRSTGLMIGLILILLVAAALRVARLHDLPPGLWYDEAINGVDIRMVLAGQGLPVFFPINSGREPLFIYLQALAVALLGPTPFALRLTAALVGIATVAATYRAARSLYEHEHSTNWIALLAAAILAVSYWHLSLSRLGLRAVLTPLAAALAVGSFWRAWSTGARREYAWAGWWFGLSFYTYSSARLLPLVPALFVLTEAALDTLRLRGPSPAAAALRLAWRRRLTGLALAALVGLLVLAPLAVETIRHPGIVLGRTDTLLQSEGTTDGRPAAALGENALRVFGAFYTRGDAHPRHNLPERPATDWLTAALFSIGLLTALATLRRPTSRLLLLWFGVMLLPSILSSQAPHYLRMSGALTPYAILTALAGRALVSRLSPATRPRVLALLTAAVLLISGLLAARDYFMLWPGAPEHVKEFSIVEQQAAEAVQQALHETPQRPVLLPGALYSAPNLFFTLGPVIERSDLPPVSSEPQRITPAVAPPGWTPPTLGPDWVLWGRPGQVQATPVMPGDPARPWAPSVPLSLSFANGMRLVGYDVAPDAVPTPGPSSTITLTLYWRTEANVDRLAALSSLVFAHLVVNGAVADTDNSPILDAYRIAWPALDGLLLDQHEFVLPPGIEPTKVYAEVGQYSRRPFEPETSLHRINLIDGNGNVAGDQVNLAPVQVGPPPAAADLAGLTPWAASFEDVLSLLGWQWLDRPDGATVRLCWRAERRMATDLTAFVHLLDSSGGIASQFDVALGGPENPTSRWTPGETACTEHPLTLPTASKGPWQLRIGLYEPVSQRRLSISGDGVAPEGTSLILDVRTK